MPSTQNLIAYFATLKTLADSIEKANPSGNEEKKWKNKDVLKKLYKL